MDHYMNSGHVNTPPEALSRVSAVFTTTRCILMAAVVSTCLSLAACGGSRPANSPAHGGGTSSNAALRADAMSSEIVVGIGRYAITKAMVEHEMSVGATKQEVPDPPNYKMCIAHSEARARKATAGKVKLTVAQVARYCRHRYRELRQRALESLISSEWVIGEAAEEGLSVSEADVNREFEQSKKQSFPREAEFQQYLASTGRTTSDVKFNIKVNQLTERLFQTVQRKEGSLTQAKVAGYYTTNRRQFAVPERRDLEIVRISSDSAARRAKQEIRSGKSFASVIKRRASGLARGTTYNQPLNSKEGLVLGLVPGLYAEKPLNDAIFSAKPNVLSGPVKISLGYYVFEVKRIHPAYLETLAQAEPLIRRQLPEQLHRQTLDAFTKAWREKWIVRTYCHAGYVVQKCRQYKVSRATPPEDPYNFS
jgi:foldase protein PrsA